MIVMLQAMTRGAPVWVRITVSAIVVALYYTSFPWIFDLLGADVVDLGALPVAAVAACFGVGAGLLFIPFLISADAAILVLNGGSVDDAANLAHLTLLGAMAVGFGILRQLLSSTRSQAAKLERSESAIRTVISTAPLLLYSTDAAGRFVFRGGNALVALGHTGNNVGEDAREFYRREYPDAPNLLADVERALRGEHVADVVRTRGRVIEATWTPTRDHLGRLSGTICVGHDVTERERAEDERRSSDLRLKGIVESALDAIITVDANGAVVIFNTAAERMFGRSAAEMIGHSVEPLIPFAHRESHRQLEADYMAAGVSDRKKRAQGLSALRANGETFPIQATLSRAVVDGKTLATVIVRDITEQRRVERELERRALYDALTELPNRALFDDRIDGALATLRRDGSSGAVLVMDIDNFQETNETFGHDVGDEVLKAIGVRLRGELRDVDTLARRGGDQFAVLLGGVDERGAREVGQRLLDALKRPLVIEGQRIEQSLSIGIALFPIHGDDRMTLLRRAETATTHAKRVRRSYAVYSSADDHSNPGGLALLADLRAAIERNEIDLAFQPDIEMATGRVLRVEALARWTHATRGIVGPDRFIPLAERSGLIGALTRCVLEKAIAQSAAWRASGIELPVAVNLSVQDLLDRELPFTIGDLLQRYALPARFLSVELTESLIMSEIDRAVPTLSTLRSLGVQVALDDFGTGYSSLKYLAHLPADRIKIDRSFVRTMVGDRGAAAIVRAAIDLAHELKLEVVAEGVEEQREWMHLLAMGADSVQGYFVSRPLPGSKIPAWLEAYVSPLRVLLDEAG
jgi:diguanylate cyclase (GGDEF)-like protein/PAS domain S-box-containing protein